MTLTQYVPQWLRSRLQKPASQELKTVNKKDRQVLPTLPKSERPPTRFQDDDSPPGYRIVWRM
jgi:hypothetical protein